MDTHQNFIDGRFEDGRAAESITVLNSARDTIISHIPDSSQAAVDAAVSAARRAQPEWEKFPAIKRAGYLRQISAKVRANAEQIAHVISEEQGGFHAGRGRSGIGGADGKHGLYEHLQTHIAYIQT